MFSKEEIEKITKLAKEEDGVILATPQISLTGLVSNGTNSTIFMAQGVVPQDDRTIKGGWYDFRPIKGEGLHEKKSYGVEMAQDLAKYLNLDARQGRSGDGPDPVRPDERHGHSVVSGVYDSGSDATNDKYMRFTFDFAQSLYDTQKAERMVVLLKETKNTWKMRSLLLDKLAGAGIETEIKTWNELSLFYSKVRGMFDMMFLFIFCIVLVIVVMSTVNTMGMAVLERTREIGTLRALGLKRRGVSMLFALEGGLLGLFGSLLGVVLHVIVWAIIGVKAPTYTPPGISTPVPLRVDLIPGGLVVLVFCLILLSLAAAIIPARRAARTEHRGRIGACMT